METPPEHEPRHQRLRLEINVIVHRGHEPLLHSSRTDEFECFDETRFLSIAQDGVEEAFKRLTLSPYVRELPPRMPCPNSSRRKL